MPEGQRRAEDVVLGYMYTLPPRGFHNRTPPEMFSELALSLSRDRRGQYIAIEP
jgi:hypothetical protein